MATKEQIELKIKKLIKDLGEYKEKYKAEMTQLKSDLERIQQPDVLEVGDRVRLKRDYNTPEDNKNSSGWRAYLHFMNPNNPATIKAVECFKGKIGYQLAFDDDLCYYDFPVNDNERTYHANCLFYFGADKVTPIDKKRFYVRLNFSSFKDNWSEIELVAKPEDYKDLLEELKRRNLIHSYTIEELQ